MNKARRKELGKAFDLICQAKDILEAVKAEEREAYENLQIVSALVSEVRKWKGIWICWMRHSITWTMLILLLSRFNCQKGSENERSDIELQRTRQLEQTGL